ncbi:hypothetical protein LA080_006675 [Diaporthe eres]|uniref:Uncharacterized protein n=1 Tax=Diaporthe vaccinii TaxID=105482 RepID=A0ABR4ER22_9PEZI|nr:hypothetical protein LA080_006675 [Diaporthe eres]
MSSSVPGHFESSTSQLKPVSTGAADRIDPNIAAPKTNGNYLQDKDLNWWLTFARTFKSAVKTPLPDDDSDL